MIKLALQTKIIVMSLQVIDGKLPEEVLFVSFLNRAHKIYQTPNLDMT